MREPYRYRLKGVKKETKCYLYALQDLRSNEIVYMNLKELKPCLDANLVINAIYKYNKVHNVPDAADSINKLIQCLNNNDCVRVAITYTNKAKTTTHMKFYNMANKDITYKVYQVLIRKCSMSVKDELIVSGAYENVVATVIKTINVEAVACGLAPVINDCYVFIR